MFPLKLEKETYYAGMGEFETRNIISFQNGQKIASVDYLNWENIYKINNYVKSLEDEILRLKDVYTI